MVVTGSTGSFRHERQWNDMPLEADGAAALAALACLAGARACMGAAAWTGGAR